MGYICGIDRDQIMLLPERVDDFIGSDNIVRVIDAFVNALNMNELGFKGVVPASTGRPRYIPSDLLKLYIYGYMNSIRSSRKLESETLRNVEVMWLINMLKPDFKTIADFRKDNKAAIKAVFKQFSLLCKGWDLYGKELVAVDGTKIRASNSKHNNFTANKLERHIKYIDEKINGYLNDIAENDKEDKENNADKKPTTEDIKKLIEELNQKKLKYEEFKEAIKSGEIDQISTVDADARLMAVNNNGLDVCYNAQSVVDSKHNLIVDCEVTNNAADHGQLSAMSERAKEIFEVDELKALADKGYFNSSDLLKCEAEHIETYVAKPSFSSRAPDENFNFDKFEYDKERDVYKCPGKCELFSGRLLEKKGTVYREYRNSKACKTCELKSKCSKSIKCRTILRNIDQDFLDIVIKRTEENKDLYRKRKTMVEHPFGTIKRSMGAYYLLTRGIESVRCEISLSFLAYNMKRVINILGIEEMMRRLAVV